MAFFSVLDLFPETTDMKVRTPFASALFFFFFFFQLPLSFYSHPSVTTAAKGSSVSSVCMCCHRDGWLKQHMVREKNEVGASVRRWLGGGRLEGRMNQQWIRDFEAGPSLVACLRSRQCADCRIRQLCLVSAGTRQSWFCSYITFAPLRFHLQFMFLKQNCANFYWEYWDCNLHSMLLLLFHIILIVSARFPIQDILCKISQAQLD